MADWFRESYQMKDDEFTTHTIERIEQWEGEERRMAREREEKLAKHDFFGGVEEAAGFVKANAVVVERQEGRRVQAAALSVGTRRLRLEAILLAPGAMRLSR